MKILCKCKDCGATGWGIGVDEPDVNATEIVGLPAEWEGGRDECPHEGEIEIIDSEDEDPNDEYFN